MKKAIFLFSLLVVMSAATAFAGTLVSSSNIIVWQSEDAYKACMAELKETSGKPKQLSVRYSSFNSLCP